MQSINLDDQAREIGSKQSTISARESIQLIENQQEIENSQLY